jgi:hypothetical protein
MSKKIWIAIVIIFALLALKKCTDRWTGIIYPEKSNLANFKNIGEFKSLEQCRNESISVLHKIAAQYIGDFECGLNCKGLVCEETSK